MLNTFLHVSHCGTNMLLTTVRVHFAQLESRVQQLEQQSHTQKGALNQLASGKDTRLGAVLEQVAIAACLILHLG